MSATRNPSTKFIYLLLAASGFAALSLEVIWQIKSTLTLGFSAFGTALTLIVMMGGISLGAFLMGLYLGLVDNCKPRLLIIYGLLELCIGGCGLLLNSGFHLLEKIDSITYIHNSFGASLTDVFGLLALFCVPACCMGATFPLFALFAKQYQLPLSRLYFFNTAGAVSGIFLVDFCLIPLLGLTHTIGLIAAINISIACLTFIFSYQHTPLKAYNASSMIDAPCPDLGRLLLIVFVTGFSTFILEVAWFRSFASLCANTTDTFALLLICVLIALSLAAKRISILKKNNKSLGFQLCLAGLFILCLTPLIERLDLVFAYGKKFDAAYQHLSTQQGEFTAIISDGVSALFYFIQLGIRFIFFFLIIVPPLYYLSTAFPWIIDNPYSAKTIAKLYAVNTFASMLGALSAAWILLPLFGFAKTAWIAGSGVLLLAIFISSTAKKRFIVALLGLFTLLFAIHFETGIGKARVQGYYGSDETGQNARVLKFFEGPDATTSAVQYKDGTRALLINSTLAAWEPNQSHRQSAHYMAWMGHLPMLLHPDPKKALIICFGTGQTANAVRKENPQSLDIVDINANVFKLGHLFKSNEQVLSDPRVKTIIMDGRTYLRRTQTQYDVITLEPMPPNTVGVNALYSKEFYQLARAKLRANGIIAQWLPFHIVAPYYTASMVKTFIQVFPNAILWLDPASFTGILLGSKDESTVIGKTWPGFKRYPIQRNLSAESIVRQVVLDAHKLKQYSRMSRTISDDNELLAYGKVLYPSGLLEANFAMLRKINKQIPIPRIDARFR